MSITTPATRFRTCAAARGRFALCSSEANLMKRLTLALLGVLLPSVGLSSQATGTITLDFGNAQTINVTATQRAKLQRLLDDSNTARAAQTPAQAAQTLEQWLRAKLVDTITREFQTAEAHEQAEACAAYAALSAANQTTIKTALGGKSPCR